MSNAVYYAKASKSAYAMCKPCRDNLRITIFAGVGFVLGLSVVAYLLHRGFHHLSPAHKKSLASAWLAFKPLNKLKIMVSFYMIVTRINSVYEVELPFAIRRLLSTFSLGISLGFSGVGTPLECLGFHGYPPSLLFWMVAPVVFVGLILLAGIMYQLSVRKGIIKLSPTFAAPAFATIASYSTISAPVRTHAANANNAKGGHPSLTEVTLPWILRLLFFIYPLVTNVAFEAWPCHSALCAEHCPLFLC